MKVLGVILAGGRSSRFGSDKALAMIEGQSMLDRIRAQLGAQVAEVVVAGRDVADQPAPGLGPLGGLAGGLRYARRQGFDSVLSTGCDLPELPPGLVALLSPAPAVVLGQQLLGLWPTSLAEALLVFVQQPGHRSIRSWVDHTDARQVPWGGVLPNINTPEDLAGYLGRLRLDQRRRP